MGKVGKWKSEKPVRKKYQAGETIKKTSTSTQRMTKGSLEWEEAVQQIQKQFGISLVQAEKMMDIALAKGNKGNSYDSEGNVLPAEYAGDSGFDKPFKGDVQPTEGEALNLGEGTVDNPINVEGVTAEAESGVGQQNPLDYILEHIKGGTFDPDKQKGPGQLESRNLDKIAEGILPDADIMKSQGQDLLQALKDMASGAKTGVKKVTSTAHSIIDKLINIEDMANTSDPKVQEKALQDILKKPGMIQQIMNMLAPDKDMMINSLKGPNPQSLENSLTEKNWNLGAQGTPPPQYVTGGRIKRYAKGGALGSLLKTLAVK